ncbi:MAG: aminopeptidase P family protein [Ruminococcaceae bacterium]|nr:aminopeptidase P family protein [Oscillospiraceae bacterium]
MKNMEKYLTLLDGEVDGLLLTSRYSRLYSAEYDIAEGVAIVTKKGCRYFTDSRYIEAAENGLQGYEVIMVDREHPYVKLINEAIEEFGVTKLGFEEDYLNVAEFRYYEKGLNAELVPMNKAIHKFRQIKEEWELNLMRRAQEITDKAFSEVLGRIQVGMTEKELQAELIYCLYKNGADNTSFDPIVVSGPNTSLPHGVAGDRVIQKGDFITMDFGALYCGYCADMTRTVAVGYATEEMEKVYNTVLEAQMAGIAATKAGVTGKEIDGAARKVIADAGYGKYFGHGYGHCLGMEVHEAPGVNPSGETVMEENMIASAEPGIYLPGKFGVRIEDVLIFKENGYEDITHSPKNLIIV